MISCKISDINNVSIKTNELPNMATQKQAVINRLRTERPEEFKGSCLELYLDTREVLNEKNYSKFAHLTEADRSTILNKWVQKRYCPVDTSYKTFR